MIGRPDSVAGGPGKAWLTGFERSTMGSTLVAAGLPVIADPRPSQSFFTRSDNIVFARLGIVAHTLSSFGLHAEYHTVNDEVELVDFAHMTEMVNLVARAVRVIADGPRLQWNPGGKPEAGAGSRVHGCPGVRHLNVRSSLLPASCFLFTSHIPSPMRLETLCVHAGTGPDPVTGGITAPIHLSTTFERDVDGEFRRGFKYARDLNPTRQALEHAMALVEGGAAALAFASGQAATAAVFQALKPGDHVILPDSVYYGTPKLVNEMFVPWGLRATSVDMSDLDGRSRCGSRWNATHLGGNTIQPAAHDH